MKFALVLTFGFLTVASEANANVTSAAPLIPGRPAGVRNAQFEGGNGMLIVAGASLIGITVALASAGSGASATTTAPTTSSTSTTSTTP
jgi:hypothetical protein